MPWHAMLAYTGETASTCTSTVQGVCLLTPLAGYRVIGLQFPPWVLPQPVTAASGALCARLPCRREMLCTSMSGELHAHVLVQCWPDEQWLSIQHIRLFAARGMNAI